jgi:hypothetical protein
LITVALTATIDAEGVRVWRAIVDATERPLWDDRILGEIQLPKPRVRGRPSTRSTRSNHHANAIRRTAWRFRLAGIPLVMVDEVHRQEGHERLVGRISIGSMHFDQVITVHEERDPSGPHTRLGMKLVASNSIAVISEFVPRLDVQRILIEYVDTTLRQVRKHCEADERLMLPPLPTLPKLRQSTLT